MGLISWPPLLPPNSIFCFEVWFIPNGFRYSLLTLTVSDTGISSQVQASSFMAAWAELAVPARRHQFECAVDWHEL